MRKTLAQMIHHAKRKAAMSDIFENPHRGHGLPDLGALPSSDTDAVATLLTKCPQHAQTPLLDASALAKDFGIGALYIKDERARMGLGSFKALGAAYAIACDAAKGPMADRCYVTASAGNHGLSVAAGAKVFGAKAVIFLSDSVPEPFSERLRGMGAQVERAGANYEASMDAALESATREGWTLLSDSSWPGYTDMPYKVMEGYLQMATECVAQMEEPPTHIMLQAGVGGLAAAVARHARVSWADAPQIIVVEPDFAPALIESIRAGHIVDTTGPVSAMGRLDCKTPSMIAMAGLAKDADVFVTVSEEEADKTVETLSAQGLATTPSGAAGITALFARRPEIGPDARVLTILSEGPEGG